MRSRNEIDGVRGPAPLECRRCGEVIGVYEPMVVLSEGDQGVTSVAALQSEPSAAEACFHLDCFAGRDSA
jgi:hypothetical protein